MDLLYLDYNCFQRGFDDPRQVRIQMEALACQEIFSRAEKGKVRLVWSFMHEDETIICPFPERKCEVFRLTTLCEIQVGPNKEIYTMAKCLQKKGGLSTNDAIHVACAVDVHADFFLTCDDKLIKQAHQSEIRLCVMNPVDYVRQEVI